MSVGAGLDFVREDDFVEYFLFPQISSDNGDAEKVYSQLKNILMQIKEFVEGHTQNYIWHKDEFNLFIRADCNQILIEEDNNQKNVRLPPHLYGITHYGDNIQDEWFIVFLMFEVAKKFPDIVGRVVDSDGEFLLIEAADVLPKWANPDTCEQRVYIYQGHLQLVQNSPSNTSTVLPISTGIAKILQNPKLYRVSNEIQSCIDERLKEFANNMDSFFHYQIVRVPLAVAAILKEKPSLIAPACRAFCERDPIDLKACRAMRFFPPENRVRTSLKFTRCLYAMIMHNNYVPDRRIGWDLPSLGTDGYKEDLLGVKIACGFEILASQAKEDNIENDRGWKTYLNSLVKKGYFKNNLEGSTEYCRLMKDAKQYYRENLQKFRTFPVVGKEILTLLRSLDINVEQMKIDENNLRSSDSDDWMNISAEDLDAMLTAKYGVKKLFNCNGQINAAEFTENIAEFLDKTSELEGIKPSNNPSTPSRRGITKNLSMRKAVDEHPFREDKSKRSQSNDISFDPDSFQTHVKNFLDFVIPEDDWESNSDMSDYEDEDDLEKNFENMEKTKMNIKTDIKLYMDQMDRELAATTIGKTFDTAKRSEGDDFDDIESFKPIDIDVNTLRNMMDSYKSQMGGSGPTSNLLGAMGMGMTHNRSPNDTDSNTSDLNGTQV